MTPYLALFRGVGGATQLPVAPLRAALAAEGFQRVATYINSGNAVLASDLDRDAVLAGVTRAAASLGFAKDIHLIARPEWEAVVANLPFPGHAGTHVHAAWLAQPPDPARIAALHAVAATEPPNAFAVVGRAAYLLTPDGFSRSELARRFDRGIGVANTARNWNTVLRLRDLLRAADA